MQSNKQHREAGALYCAERTTTTPKQLLGHDLQHVLKTKLSGIGDLSTSWGCLLLLGLAKLLSGVLIRPLLQRHGLLAVCSSMQKVLTKKLVTVPMWHCLAHSACFVVDQTTECHNKAINHPGNLMWRAQPSTPTSSSRTILKGYISLDDDALDKLDRALDSEALSMDQRGRSLSQGLHLVNKLVVLVIQLDHGTAWHS